MTVAFWCVLVAALLPYVGTLSSKIGGRMPTADNRRPREWLAKVEGWPKRAHWFQLNSFEAFPAFAAAVIVATLAHGDPSMINGLAVAFIVLRLVYFVCYLADWATLRSSTWLLGVVCVVWLFCLGA
ncbi:MAG TPA: MAPEG family protein [Nevskiaceae bacterium]|nr:MAPEG family protein [Nevskiaceae bacterium]